MIDDIALARAIISACAIGLAVLLWARANQCETFWEWLKRSHNYPEKRRKGK